MKVFIAGITGATGRQLAEQLLVQGHSIVAVARSTASLPIAFLEQPELEIHINSLLEMPDQQLAELVQGCDAIASCLGHNMNPRGIWGQPRLLVRDAVSRLYQVAEKLGSPQKPIRLVLMGSIGVQNPDGSEHYALADRTVLSILRQLTPPHRDNEVAAEFLSSQRNPAVQWAIVRPASLRDEPEVTPYQAFTSAQSGVIFGSAFTSRRNVAAFMMNLMSDAQSWARWQGKMPAIYNAAALQEA